MSYPYGGGGGGYPPAQGGYPQQPGYPGGGYPPQQGGAQMPDPYGAQPPYPGGGAPYPGGAGGLPYPAQPPDIGFGGVSGQPMPPPAMPAGPGQPYQAAYQSPQLPPGGYQPPGGYPAAGGYPAQTGTGAGYPQAPAAGGPGYPQAAPPQPSYPQAGGAGGYPQSGGAGGYPQSGGYPQPSQPAASGSAPYQPPPAAFNYTAPSGSTATAPGGPGLNKAMKGLTVNPKPREDGTVRPAANFNAERDAEVLRKAMKGLGTDEKAIIDILGYRSNAQRQEIKKMFKTMYGRDLIHDLKSELGGKFEDVVLGVMMTPAEFDASSMRAAMKGAGTDEDCLIEILSTRTNAQIMEAKSMYKTLFKRDLEKDLKSETSGHFERLLVSLANASRKEGQPIDQEQAKRHAQELYTAGEKRWGTDESTFNKVLCSQSYEQLRVVFDEYRKISNRTMEQVIKSEMSGDLKDGMQALVKCVGTRPAYFAEVLYKSMKGLGTNDRQLIRAVVSRCEVDMVQIKQEFQSRYGQSLEKFIEDDCSGDYKRMLIALVRTK